MLLPLSNPVYFYPHKDPKYKFLPYLHIVAAPGVVRKDKQDKKNPTGVSYSTDWRLSLITQLVKFYDIWGHLSAALQMELDKRG